MIVRFDITNVEQLHGCAHAFPDLQSGSFIGGFVIHICYKEKLPLTIFSNSELKTLNDGINGKVFVNEWPVNAITGRRKHLSLN